MASHISSQDRFYTTALLRDASIKAERKRRIDLRDKRLLERRKKRALSDSENDPEAQLRSLFSAIRTHTNSDVELCVSMSPSQLFQSTLKALSEPPSKHAVAQSKFMGEAMDLVSKLNAMLSSR